MINYSPCTYVTIFYTPNPQPRSYNLLPAPASYINQLTCIAYSPPAPPPTYITCGVEDLKGTYSYVMEKLGSVREVMICACGRLHWRYDGHVRSNFEFFACMYVCMQRRGEERRGDVFDSEMGISLSYYMCFALLCFT